MKERYYVITREFKKVQLDYKEAAIDGDAPTNEECVSAFDAAVTVGAGLGC